MTPCLGLQREVNVSGGNAVNRGEYSLHFLTLLYIPKILTLSRMLPYAIIKYRYDYYSSFLQRRNTFESLL